MPVIFIAIGGRMSTPTTTITLEHRLELTPGDNTAAYSAGNSNDTLLFSGAAATSPTARWARISGGPAVTPLSRAQAQTDVVSTSPTNGNSSARIHCPNVLGTNFLVRAELVGAANGIRVISASTGIMTMWSRLDVEVARMSGAHSLAGVLSNIPKFFHPACVQLDFQTEKTVTGSLDKAEMAGSRNLLSSATSSWVNNAGVFSHSGQGGWFFLGRCKAALLITNRRYACSSLRREYLYIGDYRQ